MPNLWNVRIKIGKSFLLFFGLICFFLVITAIFFSFLHRFLLWFYLSIFDGFLGHFFLSIILLTLLHRFLLGFFLLSISFYYGFFLGSLDVHVLLFLGFWAFTKLVSLLKRDFVFGAICIRVGAFSMLFPSYPSTTILSSILSLKRSFTFFQALHILTRILPAISPLKCSTSVHQTIFPLPTVLHTFGPGEHATSAEFVVLPLSVVQRTISTFQHALSVFTSLIVLAFVGVSVLPVFVAGSLLLVVFPFAFLIRTISVS